MRLGTSTKRTLASVTDAVTGFLIAWIWCVVLASPSMATEMDATTEAKASELATTTDSRGQREFFETNIRPLLAQHCYECHSQKSNKVRAGLLVDSLPDLMRGGDSGPAIVVGNPDESLLISAVRHEAFEMPPSGKLRDDQIADLEKWVRDGAWWPEEENSQRTGRQGVVDPAAERAARRARHWAWQPIVAPPLPDVMQQSWCEQPVDRFILAALEAHDLTPASAADRATLIRRLTFDLTGLPPEPTDVSSFVANPHPDAYGQLVDRLLASPAFGEKWARHWLDLMRFAESCGHEFDFPIRHADGYRDYVIRAWNDDVAYDQWVREHVAGDLLAPPRVNVATGLNESIRGTGFWWLGEANHAPTDVRADEADRIDNQLSVFGKAFLGLTIGCARCHDHKFDPISADDYYALAGFLQSSRRQEALLDPHGQIERKHSAIVAQRKRVNESARIWLASNLETPGYWTDCLLAVVGLGSATESRVRSPETSLVSSSIPAGRWELWRRAFATLESSPGPQTLQLWQQATATLPAESTASSPVTLSWLSRWRDGLRNDDEARSRAVTFIDFRRDRLDGWFGTGQAIPTAPLRGSHVERFSDEGVVTWAKPGTVDSGLVGTRFRGVLRSPTFTLQHRQIHHYLRGRGVDIRLVVDGYMMNEFSALLFADHMLKGIETNGQWKWITQQQDLDHYLGHKAHLEYIDHGDGEWALQSVLFSNDGPPPDSVDVSIRNWLSAEDAAPDNFHSLAAQLGQDIHRALRSVAEDRANDEETELVNWLCRHQLISPATNASWQTDWKFIQDANDSVVEPVLALASTDGTGENECLQIRGNTKNLGPEIPRRLLNAMSGEAQPLITNGSGRLELAERMLAHDNPFVARVMVNRLWQHLFGRGLVTTVDDFGAMGQPPTHPELLDFLAHDLRTHGWSLKRSVRQLVLSQVYRQNSEQREPSLELKDPENRLWHRADVKRLPAESLRDAILALSSRLDRTVGGSSVPVYLTDFMTARGQPPSGPLDGAGRRSIYTRVQRNFPSSMMLVFDVPTPFGTVGRRSQSNVPAQSLVLMNDPFVWSQAELWGKQLRATGRTTDDRLQLAALRAWGRELEPNELSALRKFAQTQSEEYEGNLDATDLWTDIAHVFLNTKEFLYLY